MTLRRRLILTCLAVSVPTAIIPYQATEWLRTRDMTLSVERFAAAQMTDDVRARCESYPQWFLAGPRENQPTPQERAVPDADVLVKRPVTDPLPFEYFAYDQEFSPTSTAGPAFPRDFKNKLKTSVAPVTAPFVTSAGTGVQTARPTGWGANCAYMLFRLRPGPRQSTERVILFLSLVGVVFAATLAASLGMARRIRRLARAARESARSEYTAIAPVKARDEIASLAFDFNEAGADIRRRIVDVKDREGMLRRLVVSTTEDVARPLDMLAARLDALDRRAQLSAEDRERLRQALGDAHALASHLNDLTATATLRMRSQSEATEEVDLTALVERVVARHQSIARASGVIVVPRTPAGPTRIGGDTKLVEQAIGNLVDNAIRYNRPAGLVAIALDRDDAARRFSLRVTDNGPGVSDEHLVRLNAVGRFRGDEGRSSRPGALGLGLAIVREVGDRFGIKWEFRKAAGGGFEAELSGSTR